MNVQHCRRCYSNSLIESCDNSIVCVMCGLVNSLDRISDTEFNYSDFSGEKNNHLNRIWNYIITHDVYTETYYKECVSTYSYDAPNEAKMHELVLEDIRESMELEEYRELKEAFIRDQSQSNTQAILRHVKPSKKLQEDYISKKSSGVISSFTRKNFMNRWMCLKQYLMEVYDIYPLPMLLEYDEYDIITRVHETLNVNFKNAKKLHSQNIFKNRKAKPNSKVFTVFIMILIDPDFYWKHKDLIKLPSKKTCIKAMKHIMSMIIFTYWKDPLFTAHELAMLLILEYHNNGISELVDYCDLFLTQNTKKRYLQKLRDLWIKINKKNPVRTIISPLYGQIQIN